MRGTVIVLVVFFATGVSLLQAAEPTDVRMAQLLSQPQKYHGKSIRVRGFLRLEFEGNALYRHKQDYQQQRYQNSVWVDLIETKAYMKLNMRYVVIEGIFNAKSRGHLGLFRGTIGRIMRVRQSDEA
jgi:hypothetical protein